MNNFEGNSIKLIRSLFDKNPDQINKINEADSEVFNIFGQKLCINIDEFSKEDRFLEMNPYRLGWNIATGTLTDIYVTGGIPKHYLHSMVLGQNWKDDYLMEFCKGISDVLRNNEVALLGGDFGKAESWSYTGVALGQVEKPIFRSGAKEGEIIYITGAIGLGNLEAFFSFLPKCDYSKLIKDKFEVSKEKAKLLRKYGTSAIDTSDGVFNSLEILSRESKVGYSVKNPLLNKKGRRLAKLMGINPLILFLGEAGEYELLFTLKKEDEEDFLKEVEEKNLNFHKLGYILKEDKELEYEGKKIDLSKIDFRARDFENIKDYIKKINRL